MKSPWKHATWLLLGLLGPGCEPPWGDPPDYEGVFQTRRVQQWRIAVRSEDWLRLIADPASSPCQGGGLGPTCASDLDCPATCRCEEALCATHYVPAEVEVDGEALGEVGLRLLGDRKAAKPNLRLRFDEFDSTRRLGGFKRVNLRANAGDPTQIREALALALMQRAGVPAPRYGFAFVRINAGSGGLYTLVQQVDRKFLEDRFGEDAGALFKIERGGTLVYQGDDPAGYDPPFERLYELETDDGTTDAAELVELMRALDAAPAGRLGEAVDIEEVLRALAVNTWLANQDAYPGTADNLFLYRQADGTFAWIPWGLNRAFGNYHGPACSHSADEMLALDPDRPTCGGPRPLVDRLLADPALRARYHAELRNLMGSALDPERVLSEIAALRALVLESLGEDLLQGFTLKEIVGAFDRDVPEGDNPLRVPGLAAFVERRAAFLHERLEALEASR